MIAILNDNIDCKKIDIVGDGISGIFDTAYKFDIDRVFSTAAKLSSLINIMNFKFQQRDIKQIEVGIGVAYGRALMIKAGYKGSGINEIVWMGDVVNQAAKLCSFGNATSYDRRLMVDDVFYSNLSTENQALLYRNYTRGCYHGDVINRDMNEWLKEQEEKAKRDIHNPYRRW